MTILAGRNSVGKTAVLRALRFPLEAIPGATPDFRLEYSWVVESQEIARALALADTPEFAEAKATLAARNESVLRAVFRLFPVDPLTLPETPVDTGFAPQMGAVVLTEAEVMETKLQWSYKRPAGQSPQGRLTWKDDRFVAGISPTIWSPPVAGVWRQVTTHASRSLYVHPRRVGAQTMPFMEATDLAPDGGNLTTVVATLYTNYRQTTFKELEDFIRKAFPEISRIDVLMAGGPPQATIHVVYGEGEGLKVPLQFCGTGVEQLLVLAAAVLTSVVDRIFLIDEPHAFLHPDAERSLIGFMNTHRQHQYIVATHSGVLLNAYPLNHVRLLTMEAAGTRVADVSTATDVLQAVGVTAADLWSTRCVIWLEGPSETSVVGYLIDNDEELREASLRLAAMPDAVRSASRSVKTAQAIVDFCEAIVKAILPVKVEAFFIFDADEKPDDLKNRIAGVTGGRARFLEVRELENLFLSSRAVHQILATTCSELGLESPTVDQIDGAIRELVSKVDDPGLYRLKLERPDETKVAGSEVLRRLFWDYAQSEYDKVVDGRRLAAAVLRHEPARIEPLFALIREAWAKVEAPNAIAGQR